MSRPALRPAPRSAGAARVATFAAMAAVGVLASAGCGPRRDVADLAAGLAPFGELRGMPFGALRVGQVRALRAAAARAPREGLRESLGAFDLLYAVPSYVGTDGSWPDEAALIDRLEATREWPSDSLALAAFRHARAEYASLAGRPPACLAFGGGDLTQRAAEWELGDGLMFAVAFAPTSRLDDGTSRPSRHTLAVRRRSLGERSQVVDAARDTTDDHLTWRPADCDAG